MSDVSNSADEVISEAAVQDDSESTVIYESENSQNLRLPLLQVDEQQLDRETVHFEHAENSQNSRSSLLQDDEQHLEHETIPFEHAVLVPVNENIITGSSSEDDSIEPFAFNRRWNSPSRRRARNFRRIFQSQISNQEHSVSHLPVLEPDLYDIASEILPVIIGGNSTNHATHVNDHTSVLSANVENRSENLFASEYEEQINSATTSGIRRSNSFHNLTSVLDGPEQSGPSIVTSSNIASSTQSDFTTLPGQHVQISKGASKRKLSSPILKDSKRVTMELSQDSPDDGHCCPICFESWTNSGNHRLTSLKCGHVFGQKCIERWLKDGQQKCPQCNAKAKKNDLRIIYAKKLVTIDNSELEQALRESDKLRSEKRECEMELAKTRLQYHLAEEECSRLKQQVLKLQSSQDQCKENTSAPLNIPSNSTNDPQKKSYRLIKTTVLTVNGGCRVMDFHSKTQQFVISHPSPHTNFMTGYGVRRIPLSANNFKSGCFTLLHSKPIKDVHFSPLTDHHVLSASQDGSLRITDLMSNAKIHEYKNDKPVWRCCWDNKDRNVIYAGLSNGALVQFDLRNTSEPLSSVENPNSKCPVVSLYHVPPVATEHFSVRGGLFTATLEGSTFWMDPGSTDNQAPSLIADYKPNILPLDPGSCADLQYCPQTHNFLATFRPGRTCPNTTHFFCELKSQSSTSGSSQVTCNVLDRLPGSRVHKMLSRNALFLTPDQSSSSNLFACVGDESSSKVAVYDVSKSAFVQSLRCCGPPLDITPVHVHDAPLKLAVLTQSHLQLYEYS